MRNEVPMPQSNPPLKSVRIVIPRKHYSIKAEHTYLKWIHPQDMGVLEIEVYLNHLTVERNVTAPATQCAALTGCWIPTDSTIYGVKIKRLMLKAFHGAGSVHLHL